MTNNNRSKSAWTLEEELFLHENFGKITFAEIGEKIGKSKKAVERKVWRTGLSSGFDPANHKINFWTLEEDIFLTENHLILTYEEIAKYLNRSSKSVCGRVERLKIGKVRDFWTKEKDNFLQKYYGKLTNKQLTRAFLKVFDEKKDFKLLCQNIQFRAQKLGIKSNPFHTANNNFFSEPNILNSYYAGLIASDGCIDDNRTSKALKIELHDLDGCILEKFKKDTEFTGNVNRKNTRGYSIIQIGCCQQWFKDLEKNFNITPRKSKTKYPGKKGQTLMPPRHLSRECALAFIIGLIDGDGGINVYKGNYYALSLNISSSEPMVNWVKQILSTLVLYFKTPLPKISPCCTIFRFQIIGKRAEHICKHLMRLDVPRMWRKWVLVKAWINQDTELIEAFIAHRGKKMSAWKGALKVLKKREITAKEYYEN